MCNSDEICVNSWLGDGEHRLQLARCIDKEEYEALDSTDDRIGGNRQGRANGGARGSESMHVDDDSSGDDSGHVGGEKRRKLVNGFVLEGKQASIVISNADETTPLGVRSMEVDTAVGESTTLIEKTCRDCLELRTKNLAPDTNRLNVEATLIATGTGVAAGVIWVALLSG